MISYGMNWSNSHQQVVVIKMGYKEWGNAVKRLRNFCQWGPSSQYCEWPSLARITQPLYSINSLLMIEKCLHRAARNFVRPLPKNKYLISIWCAFDVLIWLHIAELWVLFFRNSDTYFPAAPHFSKPYTHILILKFSFFKKAQKVLTKLSQLIWCLLITH